MDLKRLRTFVAVADIGTVSKAAPITFSQRRTCRRAGEDPIRTSLRGDFRM